MIEHQTVTETDDDPPVTENLPLRLHPRVFAALGKDLVTNDVVAVIELVKNAYDAFAENVWVEFSEDVEGPCLEIRDDGIGMTRQVIEDVWCLVATPFRERNPVVRKGNKVRRVVGAKGLGRLSVARLGRQLRMRTNSLGDPCWEVFVDWTRLAQTDDLNQSTVSIGECTCDVHNLASGTSLKILGLQASWDTARIDDLRENLARLISPFSETGCFNIFLSTTNRADPVRIESPDFLSKPKYSIRGTVDSCGSVDSTYGFLPVSNPALGRGKQLAMSWREILDTIPETERSQYSQDRPNCGPFQFEIRAWDIGANDTKEISDVFAIRRGLVRQAIRAHKGISVYRDGVLVLPKSENSRDWLGLDLRRVGRVGPRLSTSQLVGYVAITADNNPDIEDTSDRERLSDSTEVAEFELILRSVVHMLEIERDFDRVLPGSEQPMEDLFERLSARDLLADVTALARTQAKAVDVLPIIRTFNESLTETRDSIKDRFVYYSRLATVGTIAQMLMHEIRNRTSSIGRAVRLMKDAIDLSKHKSVGRSADQANESLRTLESLADTFSPLANRNFTRRAQRLILEQRIRYSLRLNQVEIRTKKIKCAVPSTETIIVADPAELDTILVNLIMNATYWVDRAGATTRQIEFEIIPFRADDKLRIHVFVHDSGPGIDPDYIEKIFLPGVTRKPKGIGMGLNIAAELVALYGGEMKAMRDPTKLGGASFSFDLPVVDHQEGIV